MTYIDQLKEEYDKLTKEIEAKMTECASRGDSWEKYKDSSRELLVKRMKLSQEIRLIEVPEITYGKEYVGNKIPIEKFTEMAKSGLIKNNDGYGYYATENSVSNISVYPTDFLDDKYRTDFTHILWF